MSTLAAFDPLVRGWFERRFAAVTEPQLRGWPEIQAGRDVLISAPTGSGKTLAAFLTAIDTLVRQARQGDLPNQTEVLYVSPLKALSNDVHKNLDIPLAGIAELAREQGVDLAQIRTAVRTGDTPAAERQQMGRRAPHILVTTPESLYILLTAVGPRKMLASVRTLIVDEIHAVADDKRGSHLALSIARLEALVAHTSPGVRLQKIGLSATVSPIEEVARFLSDDAHIVQAGHRRAMDLAVEVPRDELSSVASMEMWDEIYDRVAQLVQEHRTTLVFVNTRRLSERVAHHLGQRLGEQAVLPHHGSLSRKLRLDAEQRLKNGELRAVVATASLELGIDIGTVDLVCQIGSPRSIAVALQRVGRAGHWMGALPKGRLFATTRDDLIECAATVRAIRKGELDRLEIPQAPLDILAQQIVAATACEDFEEDALFALVRSAAPYRELARRDFDAIIEMLSEGIATSRGRSGAYLHRDQVNHRVRARRGARLAAITSGGAIPDTAQYQVVVEPEGFVAGTVDEDFAVESMAGDVFLLGTTSWRIRRVEAGRVRVEDAHGAAPTIPFWRGEAPGRTRELSAEVSQLREEIAAGGAEAVELLRRECMLDQRGAEQAAAYAQAGRVALGAVPTQDCVVAERFFDEAGGMQLVVHAPFGSRINKAWGLALRKRFCRTFNFELQAAATDNGLVLSLTEQHSFPLEMVFGFLKTATVEHVLTQALLASPMFAARWKWNAARALAVPRFAGGRKVPPPIQRMRADDLLASVFPDQAACAENLTGEIRIPDHPLVNETISNCLHEAMDLDGLMAILDRLEAGELRTVAVDTREPSPFCHEILNANPYAFLDDAPLEERRTRAVAMRRTLDVSDAAQIGALDPEAIAQVAEESWPLVRDADELHDALLTLILMPPVEEWRDWFEELARSHRVLTISRGTAVYWFAAERADLARHAAEDLEPEAITATLRGWMDSIGPVTPGALAQRLRLPPDAVETALAQLEAQGQILRGQFALQQTEFCHRRILARIHRLTLGRLRREIEPVTSAEFMRFLCRWQHVAPGTQQHGADGLLQILRQLQGCEIPAAAWESQVLPRRVAHYDPELLDQLCLSGEVMWGRLSPHPALESQSGRRVRPTRVAPLAVFLREDAAQLLPPLPSTPPALSHAAREVLDALTTRGASFFPELLRATGRLASEVEDGLWELVAAGLVTADGFENLRALIDPKRRRGEGRGRSARPRHAAGRWALLDRHASRNTPEQAAEFFATHLLARWGVVFRDLAAQESLAPPWRDLLQVLRRMEARGEIRRGRFVAGYVGEQFARPEALDLLRHLRRSWQSENAEREEIEIAAADPLNLTGVVLPGPRTAMLGQDSVHLTDGAQLAPAAAV
ncbi:MAG TPA: DEAD/DEAH box helicase [Bryobacteraceae bacterium]|nr:DEAD/DEAH box helicase [Bryobacteraceae bacterium]